MLIAIPSDTSDGLDATISEHFGHCAAFTVVHVDGETIGEVMLKGNIIMKGYLKNEDASDEAFAGGWFHSGDLGVIHGDNYLQLKDRSKDIIISGGENISSIEVEDVIYKRPDVTAAACEVPEPLKKRSPTLAPV